MSEDAASAAYDHRPSSADPNTKSGAAVERPLQMPDRWFDEQLSRMFDDVSAEPLPPDLAKLVGQLRAQGNKTGDK